MVNLTFHVCGSSMKFMGIEFTVLTIWLSAAEKSARSSRDVQCNDEA